MNHAALCLKGDHAETAPAAHPDTVVCPAAMEATRLLKALTLRAADTRQAESEGEPQDPKRNGKL